MHTQHGCNSYMGSNFILSGTNRLVIICYFAVVMHQSVVHLWETSCKVRMSTRRTGYYICETYTGHHTTSAIQGCYSETFKNHYDLWNHLQALYTCCEANSIMSLQCISSMGSPNKYFNNNLLLPVKNMTPGAVIISWVLFYIVFTCDDTNKSRFDLWRHAFIWFNVSLDGLIVHLRIQSIKEGESHYQNLSLP